MLGGYLGDHIPCHTGEKRIFYKFCDHKFYGYLGDHNQCHSGEKPIVCNLCNYRLDGYLDVYTKLSDSNYEYMKQNCFKVLYKQPDLHTRDMYNAVCNSKEKSCRYDECEHGFLSCLNFRVDNKINNEYIMLSNNELYYIIQSRNIYLDRICPLPYITEYSTNLFQYLHVAKNMSKQLFAIIPYTNCKPLPNSNSLLLIMLLMCGGTGTLVNTGPIDKSGYNTNLNDIYSEQSNFNDVFSLVDPDLHHFTHDVNFVSHSVTSFANNYIDPDGLKIIHHNARSIMKPG